MSEIQSPLKLDRGRIFPEVQWSEEKKAQWQAKRAEFHQSCQRIFEQVKAELIETHYNWYLAVEPQSQEYFLAKTEWEAIALSRAKYPHAPFHLFQVNETGICGAK
ncbi:MAG TPA: hypothetical protein DD761_20885 [Cyanobacteria bacterium UBA11691]|nr:hypothetical protein [Cyanobacteria bacterium UBA11691]